MFHFSCFLLKPSRLVTVKFYPKMMMTKRRKKRKTVRREKKVIPILLPVFTKSAIFPRAKMTENITSGVALVRETNPLRKNRQQGQQRNSLELLANHMLLVLKLQNQLPGLRKSRRRLLLSKMNRLLLLRLQKAKKEMLRLISRRLRLLKQQGEKSKGHNSRCQRI